MGEASRRKALGLGRKNNDIQLARQAELYKQTKILRPDLGMALALLEYTQPLMIGCFDPKTTKDVQWNFSIGGVLNSYTRTGENHLPHLPLSESYYFTIAWRDSDELSLDEAFSKLISHNLVVEIKPEYKYLTTNKKEWVLPLVLVNYLTA